MVGDSFSVQLRTAISLILCLILEQLSSLTLAKEWEVSTIRGHHQGEVAGRKVGRSAGHVSRAQA